MLTPIYDLYQQLARSIVSLLLPLGYGWSLFVISVVLGVILVFIYGKVSAQKSIAKVKKKISANILESILFRHDVGVSLSAQGKAMMLALNYAALAIPPLIILLVPVILILGQLFPVFGLHDPQKSSPLIVTAQLTTPDAVKEVRLISSGDKNEEFLSVGATSILEKSWRIDSLPEKIIFESKNGAITLPVSGDSRIPGIDSVWMAWIFGYLTVPSELSNQVKSLHIEFPDRTIYWLGLEWNWIILFFIVSLVAGLVFSRFARIEI
jgi:uncharacterized membrane protein (DUF106 family)